MSANIEVQVQVQINDPIKYKEKPGGKLKMGLKSLKVILSKENSHSEGLKKSLKI